MGYLQIDRIIKEFGWWDDPLTRGVFVGLVIDANYEQTIWHGIVVERGQVIFALRSYAENNGLTLQQFRTCLNRLKSTQNITQKSTHHYTLVTICQYDLYTMGEKSPTQQLTQQQHAINTPLTQQQHYHKELKNKEIKETIYTDEFIRFWDAYPRKTDKGSALKAWNSRIKAKVDPEVMIQGAKNYATSVIGSEPKYTKMPATFLNAESYMNDFKQASQPISRYADLSAPR